MSNYTYLLWPTSAYDLQQLAISQESVFELDIRKQMNKQVLCSEVSYITYLCSMVMQSCVLVELEH